MTPATKPTLSKHQSHPLTQSIRSASAMKVEHSHTAAPGGQTMSLTAEEIASRIDKPVWLVEKHLQSLIAKGLVKAIDPKAEAQSDV